MKGFLMKNGLVFSLALVATLGLADCGTGAVHNDETNPSSAGSGATGKPTPTATSAGIDGSADQEGDDDTHWDSDPGGESDEPIAPAADVDTASPSLVTGSISRDVSIRYPDEGVIELSPRAFTVGSKNGSTSITVKHHILGLWGSVISSPALVVVPGTWTPALACGTPPTGAVTPTSIDLAIGYVRYGDDFTITTKFLVPDSGPWYLVARDEKSQCNIAAWAIPAAGDSR